MAQALSKSIISADFRHKDIAGIAQFLQSHLGQRVTAYLGGVKDQKIVGRWAAGKGTPREKVRSRLRCGYEAARLLVDAFGDETAQAWFFGSNHLMEDEAPAYVLRYAENPDDYRMLIPATRAFIEGSP